MKIDAFCHTTHVGSVPYQELDTHRELLLCGIDIPAWAQFPRRTFRENMYVQFSEGLPGIQLDSANERIFFQTDEDLTPALEAFYERYLADDPTLFACSPDYAAGFYEAAERIREIPGKQIKGQVTGPISFGLTVTDQNLRASLYHELLADAIVKNIAMKARWQARELHQLRPQVMICVDEPYMASFGSAYISLSREQVIMMLNEVFAAIHAEGASAAVHCCANTDWSVLLETEVDILNLDALGYLENLALYPAELRAFLDRGGIVAWGIVPNNETIAEYSPEQLATKLLAGMTLISEKAQARGISITVADFAAQSLITPACGLGSAPEAIAAQVLASLTPTAQAVRELVTA